MKINEVTGKPMGIIGFFKRIIAASKARKLDEGMFERKEYDRQRKLRLKQTQYETALQYKLKEETMKLQSGSSRSFEFELEPGMYQYFMALCDSAEFRACKFEEIGKFKYLVTLNGGVYSEKR